MMHRRRDCAKSVIDSNNDLNMVKSWAFALKSAARMETPLLVLDLFAFCRYIMVVCIPRVFRVRALMLW